MQQNQPRQHLNRANSLKFIQLMLLWVFPRYLELYPNDWMHVFFQVDGASIHTSNETTAFMDENFPLRWIGNNGPILWPPRY